MSVHSLSRDAKPALPSVDELIADPTRARELSPQMRAALIVTLAAPSLVTGTAATPSPEPADQWLTCEEAAKLLHRSPRWIWRGKAKLPFVRVISGRSLLCSRQGIEKWLAGRKVR
jgi:hypothetical protein